MPPDPSTFVEEVREELARRGFYIGLVTAKRVWRTYERLVRRGFLFDVLGALRKGDREG